MPRHVSVEVLRRGAESTARQVAQQCAAEGIRAGVLVVIVPLEEQDQQQFSYAINVQKEHAPERGHLQGVLHRVSKEVMVQEMVIQPGKGAA